MNCRSCGAEVSPGARFCSNCGASQATAGEERRVITALFADIVGFTALAERRDPEEVKRLVDRAFAQLTAEITSFGGVVDKIVGDEIVALFGAPVAHSDDAERAVRAGLRMQSVIAGLSDELDPPLELRIGIRTGEVLVGSTSAGGDYTAMGDVMNTASRLQNLASAGQVLVGDATVKSTGEAIRYQALGSLPTRGRDRPLEAWLAIEATQLPGAHRRKSDVFVGRERELAFLEAQAAIATGLDLAQLAVVVGEAGMGKTRLVAETVNRLADKGDLVALEGRCVAYGEANVWFPVAEILRRLYALDPDLDPASSETALRAAMRKRFGHDDPEVERWMMALSHAMGHETPLRGRDKRRNRAEVSLAVAQVLDFELARRPVALVLTDMHWAAEAVWSLLDHLLAELARRPLFVLVSAQDVDRSEVFAGRHGASVLRLGPLPPAASRLLLGAIGADIPEETAEALVQRSGGNPFFLEELAGLVLSGEAGPLAVGATGSGARVGAGPATKAEPGSGPQPGVPNPSVAVASGSAPAAAIDQLPGTLRGIVAARLDSLESDQRSLIDDASVLGRTGPIDGLAILAREGRGVHEIDGALAALVALDLLAVSGPRYEFQSELVRDVAYATLTKTVRVQRHVGIARHLEGIQSGRIRSSVIVAIADHYRAAANLLDELTIVPGIDQDQVNERALYWIGRAAARAMEVDESVEGARWYDLGVALAAETEATDEVTASFLYGRARARCEIHDITGARADLQLLEPLIRTDPATAARALVVSGDVDRKAGDFDRAAGQLREAADRLAALAEPGTQALALRLLGLTEMERGDDTLARQALEASRQVGARAGDRRSEAWALQTLAWHAFIRGDVMSAGELANQANTIFAELGDRGGLAWVRGVQAWVAFHLGQWNTARELVATVLPETRRRGDPWAESIMLHLSAALALWSGQARSARELARQSQEVSEGAEVRSVLIQSMALEGRALVSLGRVDEGTALLERAFTVADRSSDRNARRIAVISNCASAARLGDAERAIRWAARFDGVHDNPAAVGETDLAVSLALALLQRGAVAEAANQLAWSGDPGPVGGGGAYHQAVAAVLAVVEGRPEDAEVAVRELLAGPATYLDRVLALAGVAAGRRQRGNETGVVEALAAAEAELASTDDQVSRLQLELVAAHCGRGRLDDADRSLRNAGIDPAGWSTVWSLATQRRSVER